MQKETLYFISQIISTSYIALKYSGPWRPYKIKDILLLERVQRIATN